MCVFLKNGAVVKYFVDRGGEPDSVEYFDRHSVMRWRKIMVAHHAMISSRDEKLLYLISLEKRNYHGKETKFDTLFALNMDDGSTKASWKMADIITPIEKEFKDWAPLRTKIEPDQQYSKWLGRYENEFTHANSINLVPVGTPGLEKAEIIVNAGRGFELFFTRDLQLLRIFWVDKYWRVNSHDAQVTKKGELLIYKNWVKDDLGSAIEIRSLFDNQLLWKYDRTPDGGNFKSPMLGSVQLLEDEEKMIFTDIENGGHFREIDLKTNTVLADQSHPDIDPRNKLPQKFLTIRKLHYKDLSQNLRELLESDNEISPLTELYRFILKF